MTILWQAGADRSRATRLTAFQSFVAVRHALDIASYPELQQWAIDESAAFWEAVWDFCGVVAASRGETGLKPDDHMIDARFFPEARLNFTENLLRRHDGADAIVFRSETGYQSRISWQELQAVVSRLSRAFQDTGVAPRDRVVACLPNIPETVYATLATAALGATWSSCSPDFGVQGVLDRFQQIAPKVLIACDGYVYNGKRIDIRDKLMHIVAGLPSLQQVIIVPHLQQVEGVTLDISSIPGAVMLDEYLADYVAEAIDYPQFVFDHPLYILFSSGTTGLPKCIVHGAGGTLLQHMKEHQLHSDIRPGDRVFFFTTCGWMMWNWLVSALASKATLMLYDGSPFAPDDNVLWDYADDEHFSFFGTSARYLQAMEKKAMAPVDSHELSELRTIASTGSPLLPESFDYVYRAIKADICLSSISGGTDIVSCFVLGNPNGPVYRGEIQTAGLGMAVAILNEAGQAVVGEKGELVCTRPFPSMPVGFWDDDNNRRYLDAYFRRFPGIWAHGDFAGQTATGGYIIYGRSDAVLNPGGVRIGTAEIYRQVEVFNEVLEGVAVAQDREGDTRILLFVVLRPGVSLDDKLIQRIQQQIREGASPRHVPAQVYAVTDIPRTRSGKISELAVRDVIHGRSLGNSEALANPEALENFRVFFEHES